MAKLLKLRRGTTSQHSSFTGAEGEVTVDTDKETLVVHDGSTAGGHPVAAEDMANVSSASIAGRLANDSIATTKIAAGALPTDVTITDSNISGNLTIVSADIVDASIVTGDIANSAINADKLANGAVTNSKLATMDSSRVLGRISNGTGSVQYLTGANIRSIANVEDGATADQTKADIDALNINADQLDGQHGSFYQNAGNLNAGTISDSRLPSSISSDITGTAAVASAVTITGTNSNSTFYPLFTSGTGNQTVYNDGGGGLSFNASSNTLSAGTFSGTHSGNGASLTSLNASNISSGTISSSRVPTLNQNTTGNAATATKLATARQIAGVSFDGTGNISLNNNNITNGAGYTTFSSNQATNSGSNVTFGTINCSSLTATGNVTAYSDETLKKDVATINNALSLCGQLRGVSYKWKKDDVASIGVIAQEVQKVIPEVVLPGKYTDPTTGEERDVLAVDYQKIVGVLINAINELKAEVDALKGGS